MSSDPFMGVVSIKNLHVKEGHNPRTNFDPGELDALASSVEATTGLVQPLAVEPIDGRPGHYWIIDGERRWRILSAAEVKKAPVFVPPTDNAKLAATAANVRVLTRSLTNAYWREQGLQGFTDPYRRFRDAMRTAGCGPARPVVWEGRG